MALWGGACLVALGSFAGPSVQAADSKESIRILFVGNSYTGQVRRAVTDLIEASPHGSRVEMEFITPGGKNLEFHLKNASTMGRVAEGDWDLVVLQDQSQTPAVFPDRFLSAADELDKRIDSAGAGTVFYQTWGRRDGDKKNAERFPTYKSMQEALTKNYTKAAKRAKAQLAPVGEVWEQVREMDEALGRELYKGDGSHPSAKGAYLVACVFYLTFFKESAADIDFTEGVSESEKAVIHKAIAKIQDK